MKVIIAGSRNLSETLAYAAIERCVYEAAFLITEVVSGGARGVDFAGEVWGLHNHIPVKLFRANWEAYGRAAGPIRNKEMAEYADAAIVIHYGTRGSLDMLKCARKANLKIYEMRITAVEVDSSKLGLDLP